MQFLVDESAAAGWIFSWFLKGDLCWDFKLVISDNDFLILLPNDELFIILSPFIVNNNNNFRKLDSTEV